MFIIGLGNDSEVWMWKLTGLYAECLLEHLATPFVPIQRTLSRVNKDVVLKSQGKQRPVRAQKEKKSFSCCLLLFQTFALHSPRYLINIQSHPTHSQRSLFLYYTHVDHILYACTVLIRYSLSIVASLKASPCSMMMTTNKSSLFLAMRPCVGQ